MKTKTTAIALSIALIFSGCTSVTQKSQIDSNGYEMDRTNQKLLASVMADKHTVVVKVPRAWLAPKVTNLGEDAALPAMFSNAKTWPFGSGLRERLNLKTIAERITKNTGIPVRLNPDVISGSFTNAAMRPAPAGNTPVASGVSLPPPPVASGSMSLSSSLANADDDSMDVNYTGTLADFLSRVSNHFGVNWEYRNGTIHIYKYVTKIFHLNANPGDSTFNSSLGRTSGGSGSSGTSGSNFTSAGQVTMNSTFSVWKTIQEELDSIKTPEGKVTISQATGSIVMRDTRDAIEAAEKIIEHENAMLTQQVAISVEMYSVTNTDNRDLGINWNLVFTKLSNLTPQFKLDLTSPTSLAGSNAGGLGLSIVAPATNDNSILQRFSGSQAILQALQGVGRVQLLQTAEAITLNRQPTPLAATSQQTYLASTSPGSTGSGGGSALPGLTPGTVTTGFMTNLLPSVLENGNVLLQFSLDSSQLQSMGIVSTGEGVTQQKIQTPNVTDNSTIQRVALKPGSTLVLTGLRRNSEQYNQSTLTGQVGLGGSYSGQRERDSVVILVTVKLIPGA